jgi:hypothetical protein
VFLAVVPLRPFAIGHTERLEIRFDGGAGGLTRLGVDELVTMANEHWIKRLLFLSYVTFLIGVNRDIHDWCRGECGLRTPHDPDRYPSPPTKNRAQPFSVVDRGVGSASRAVQCLPQSGSQCVKHSGTANVIAVEIHMDDAAD